MKKTIIALMALAGAATAADLSLTTGILYTPAGGEATLISGYTNPSNNNIGYSSNYWPGSRNLSSLDFTITLSGLYGASEINDTDTITLSSLKIKVTGSGWCQDEGRQITLTTGDYSYTAELEDIFTGPGGNSGNVEGYLTLSPKGWTLSKDSILNVSITPAEGKTTDNFSVASADIYGQNNASVAWSGVTNVDMTDNWGNEAPLIQLNVTTTSSTPAVPEPTTATLSLLALAGLAARRRRK
ncbi:MAG: PEP-CTERM sorting domain-containing protein [Akkermansia sp.]|nr:PEP-CTERM sorting domain-containing protein [Akkermansia sp.]